MMEFLIYDLKVAVCIAVFYMFFRLMLSRETLHRMNRMLLLTTAVASFLLPLCVVTIHHTVVVPRVTSVITAEMPMIAVLEEPSQPLWQQLLITAFFAGVAVTMAHLLWSVAQVVRLICRSEQHPQPDGTVVCVVDNDVSPFSWMRYIVLSRQDYEQKDPAIMAHERGHISQRHSLDVVLVFCNGSTPPCGSYARICAPSTSTRPMQRYSLKASICVSISICLSKKPSPRAGTLWPTVLLTVPSKIA